MAEQLEFEGIYNGEADAINPSHYRQGGIECIDAMKEMLGDGFEYYLQGAILKYLWRYHYKGKPEQDLQKAHWYLELLLETVRTKYGGQNGKG